MGAQLTLNALGDVVQLILRVVITFVLVSGGCAAFTSVTPTSQCVDPVIDTGAWQLVDEGLFSFRVPPAFAEVSVSPIDSNVRQWEAGPLRVVHFDAGPWSSTLRELRVLQGYSECRASIGGENALLVSGWDKEAGVVEPGRKYVVAATWRDIRPGVHLTLIGTTPDAEEQRTMLAVIRSVRFEMAE